jgi:hypothetical protein
LVVLGFPYLSSSYFSCYYDLLSVVVVGIPRQFKRLWNPFEAFLRFSARLG